MFKRDYQKNNLRKNYQIQNCSLNKFLVLTLFVILNLIFIQGNAERTILLQAKTQYYASSAGFNVGYLGLNDIVKVAIDYDSAFGPIGQILYTLYFISGSMTLTANTFPYSYELTALGQYLWIIFEKPNNLKTATIFHLTVYVNNGVRLNRYFYFTNFDNDSQVIIGSFKPFHKDQIVYINSDNNNYWYGYYYYGLKYKNGTKLTSLNNQYYWWWWNYQPTYKVQSAQQALYLYTFNQYQYYYYTKFTVTVSAEKNCEAIPNSNSPINQTACTCNPEYNFILLSDGSNECIHQSKTIFDSNLNQNVRNCAIVDNSYGTLQENSVLNCKCEIGYQWSKSDQACVSEYLQAKQFLANRLVFAAFGGSAILVLTIIILVILCCCGCIRCTKSFKNKVSDQSVNKNTVTTLDLQSMVVCPICLENNPEIISKCKHKYHKDCIKEWFKKNKTCPNCTQEFDQSEINDMIQKKNERNGEDREYEYRVEPTLETFRNQSQNPQ